MGKLEITRKKFLTTALAGFASIKFIPKTNSENLLIPLVRHNLGKTGIAISPICFGASRANDESLIKYTIDKGINFIDTGRAYADGNNEKLIGKVISGRRENVVIQSKLRLDPNELPSEGKGKKGASEIRNILSSKIEASLKALNSDYIDILLYHDAREESLLFHPEVIKFYAGLKSSGVIRAHGFSTHNDRMILLERNNKECFYDVIMVPFNHKGSFIHSVTGKYSEWDQNRLIQILVEAGEKGIGIIAMKTCSGDKYSPSPGFEPSYKEAVKWVLQHPFISSAAIAMANFEQVDEHISLLNFL
jgi:aryl-alcohol dehydrogenase-like predicted oxidoreductase